MSESPLSVRNILERDPEFKNQLIALAKEIRGEEPIKRSPKPKPTTPRRERSAPVRNPAFREHEGLRALQKQLNGNKG